MSDNPVVYPAHVLKQLVFVALDGDTMPAFTPLLEVTVDTKPEALARLTDRALLAEAALSPEVQALHAEAPTRQLAVLGRPDQGASRLRIGGAPSF